MFTSSKQRRKRKFAVVFVQVVKKSARDVQNLSFFIYLLDSLPSSSPPPSSLPQDLRLGIRTQHSFSKSACHLFTSYVCYPKFGPLMNCFVSVSRLFQERTCVPCVHVGTPLVLGLDSVRHFFLGQWPKIVKLCRPFSTLFIMSF